SSTPAVHTSIANAHRLSWRAPAPGRVMALLVHGTAGCPDIPELTPAPGWSTMSQSFDRGWSFRVRCISYFPLEAVGGVLPQAVPSLYTTKATSPPPARNLRA